MFNSKQTQLLGSKKTTVKRQKGKHTLIKKKDKYISNGKFKLNLSQTDLTLKRVLETHLGIVYQKEIDEAFFNNNEGLLHDLIALTKEHIFCD